jgi:tryptophan synthase alpha chain
VDGVLVTDLPPEEADDWLAALSTGGLDAIMLAAPTTSDERLDRIVHAASGFVYAVSRTGVTGERAAISQDAARLTKRVRARSDRPVALGFGISSPEQVEEAARIADGVVVGSAIVRFLEEEPDGDVATMVKRLRGAA